MLTQEQINEIRAKSGLEPLQAAQTKSKNVVGRFDYLKTGLDELKENLGERGKSIKESFTSGKGGVGGLRETLNIAGQTAGAGLDVVGALAKSAYGEVTSKLSEKVSGTPTKTEEKIKKTGIELLESPAGKAAISAIKGGVDVYSGFKQQYPDVARDFENIVNIWAVLPIAKGLTSTVKGAVNLTTGITKEVSGIAAGGVKAVEKTGGYFSSRIPKLMSIFSGEGDDIITNALKDTVKADIGIKGGDIALREAIKVAGEKSLKIKNAFVKAYSTAKEKALGGYSKVLIPKSNVIGKFYDILRSYGVKIKDGVLDFTTSNIKANPGEVSKIKAALESIKGWEKFTVSELDDLKNHIGRLTKFAQEAGGSSKSPVLGTFYHQIDDIIKSRLPSNIKVKYTNLNKKFAESIEMMDDMVDAFNSGDPFTRLANALGKNKDSLRQIIEFYEKKAKDNILSVAAGRELGMEKQAAFGFLNPRSWIDFFISPEKQGEIIIKTGDKLKGILKK